MSIVSVDAYDNNDLPGPWQTGWTYKDTQPGYYCFMVANFGGVVPDTDGDIILGRVRFRSLAEGDVSINIMTYPGVDINVGLYGSCYDSQIAPNTVILYQIIALCCTHISPDPEKVFAGEIMQFTGIK